MNPQPIDGDDDVVFSDGSIALDVIDALPKRYDCRRYERCLSTAARNGWTQFHCRDCKSYEALPADDPARRLFARLGTALLRGAHGESESEPIEREPERDEQPAVETEAEARARVEAILSGEYKATERELYALVHARRRGRVRVRLSAVERSALMVLWQRAVAGEAVDVTNEETSGL